MEAGEEEEDGEEGSPGEGEAAAAAAVDAKKIQTEILVDRAWRQEYPGKCCSNVFLASDLDQTLLLCMFTAVACEVQALRLSVAPPRVTSRLHRPLAALLIPHA